MEARRVLDELKIMIECEEHLLYKTNHCKICEFEGFCKSLMMKKDTLGLLQKLNARHIRNYNNKGIFTIKQLSYTFNPKKRGKRVKTRENPYYIALKALALRENKVYIYDKVSMPRCESKIYLDMEGDSEGCFVYLIGIIILTNKGLEKRSLWLDDFENEKEMFKELIKIINKCNDPHIFYFGKYEKKVFKRIISLNLNDEIEYLLFYNSTNILDVIYSNIYFPTYSDSLKDIGNYLGFKWSEKESSGIQTFVWWWKWKKHHNKEMKDKLIVYNQEDCMALMKLVKNHHLHSLRSFDGGMN